MELNFLGSGAEVGRSCISLTSGEKTVYLDCGINAQELQPKLSLPLFANAKQPDAVLLSHGHLDHCGSIPVLFKHGAPTVYCTTPTIPIVEILLEDTLKIARDEKKPVPFSQADLKKSLRYFSALGYENQFTLFPGFKFHFIEAGHIIGASQIVVETEKKKVFYSGDFKLGETRMHKGAAIEKNPDLLVMESTYGDKSQTDRKKLEEKFFDDVQEVIDSGGVALVPCFALGRTQEILSLLSEKNLRGDVYLDGMGTRINEVYYQYSSYLKNSKGFKAGLQRGKVVSSKFDRKQALEGGSVVICTAGMLEGGPVMGYIQALEKSDVNSKLFLVGFQAENTNGRRLLQGEPLIMHGNGYRELKVTLPFKQYGFSAHAGQAELVEYVKKVGPEKVACVHGDDTATFAERLKAEGFNAVAPVNGERIKV